MLRELSAAWQWTVSGRKGLFAPDPSVDSPLASFEENKPPEPPNVLPHDIWLKFLVQRFEVAKYYSEDQVGDL